MFMIHYFISIIWDNNLVCQNNVGNFLESSRKRFGLWYIFLVLKFRLLLSVLRLSCASTPQLVFTSLHPILPALLADCCSAASAALFFFRLLCLVYGLPSGNN